MKPIDRLLDIMARLRAPDGCPWDQEQTLRTLQPYLLEEAHEVIDAIESGDPVEHCDELGDLLLQVVFQAQIRAEEEAFTFDDVATAIADKMERRHPHVFGDTVADTSAEVLKNWEQIKKEEKAAKGKAAEPASILDAVPKGLPALLHAQEIQKKAAKVGFDWPEIDGAMEKVHEEIAEVEAHPNTAHEARLAELGDLLFAVVNVIRHHGGSAETELLRANRKFDQRFRLVETAVAADGQDLRDLPLAELDRYWDAAKETLRKPAP